MLLHGTASEDDSRSPRIERRANLWPRHALELERRFPCVLRMVTSLPSCPARHNMLHAGSVRMDGIEVLIPDVLEATIQSRS